MGDSCTPRMVQRVNCGGCNILRTAPSPNFRPTALRWRDPQLPAGEQLRMRLSFWTLRDRPFKELSFPETTEPDVEVPVARLYVAADRNAPEPRKLIVPRDAPKHFPRP